MGGCKLKTGSRCDQHGGRSAPSRLRDHRTTPLPCSRGRACPARAREGSHPCTGDSRDHPCTQYGPARANRVQSRYPSSWGTACRACVPHRPDTSLGTPSRCWARRNPHRPYRIRHLPSERGRDRMDSDDHEGVPREGAPSRPPRPSNCSHSKSARGRSTRHCSNHLGTD